MFQIEKESAFLPYFSELLIKSQARANLHLFSQTHTLLMQFEMKLEGCWSYHISFTETAATRTGCSSSNHFIYSTNGISCSHTSQKLVPSVISLEALECNDTQNKGVTKVSSFKTISTLSGMGTLL